MSLSSLTEDLKTIFGNDIESVSIQKECETFGEPVTFDCCSEGDIRIDWLNPPTPRQCVMVANCCEYEREQAKKHQQKRKINHLVQKIRCHPEVNAIVLRAAALVVQANPDAFPEIHQ